MGGKAWSKQDIEFIAKNANTMTTKQMAAELGRTDAAVQLKLRQIGINKERPKDSFVTAEVEEKTKFNRLTVQRTWVEKKGNQNATRGEFLCDCGNTVTAWLTVVKQGHTKSCGCFRDEKARETVIRRNTTHGMSKHSLYSTYQGMLNRCYRPSFKQYDDYRGRGIEVCDDWRNSFEAFADWALDNGWEKGLTLDRKENEKGYSPANCRWVTHETQANNKRNNRRMTAFNETKTLSEWSRDTRCLVAYQTLYDRINKLEWDLEAALTTPARLLSKSA
jgi:hypothetical protein